MSGGGYQDFHARRRLVKPMVRLRAGARAAVCRHVRFHWRFYKRTSIRAATGELIIREQPE